MVFGRDWAWSVLVAPNILENGFRFWGIHVSLLVADSSLRLRLVIFWCDWAGLVEISLFRLKDRLCRSPTILNNAMIHVNKTQMIVVVMVLVPYISYYLSPPSTHIDCSTWVVGCNLLVWPALARIYIEVTRSPRSPPASVWTCNAFESCPKTHKKIDYLMVLLSITVNRHLFHVGCCLSVVQIWDFKIEWSLLYCGWVKF